MSLLDAAFLTAGLGVSGCCVWHCLRGIRAMRHGKAVRQGETAGCCPPAEGSAQAQLAELRRELAALQHPAGREPGAVTPPR